MDPSGESSAPKTQKGSGPPAEGRQSRRRERTKYTPEQVAFLKRIFATEPYPGYPQLLKMEATLGIPNGRLQVWFQNRRARHLKYKPRQKPDALFESTSQNPLLQDHSLPSVETEHSTDPAPGWPQHQPNCQGTTWTLTSNEGPEALQIGSWDGRLPLHPYTPCANYTYTPTGASCPGNRGGNEQQGGQPWTLQHGPPSDPEHMNFSWSMEQGVCGSQSGPSSYMQEGWTPHSSCSAPTYSSTTSPTPSSTASWWDPATLQIPPTQEDPSGWKGGSCGSFQVSHKESDLYSLDSQYFYP